MLYFEANLSMACLWMEGGVEVLKDPAVQLPVRGVRFHAELYGLDVHCTPNVLRPDFYVVLVREEE